MTEHYRGGRKGKKQEERGGGKKVAPGLCSVWEYSVGTEKTPAIVRDEE